MRRRTEERRALRSWRFCLVGLVVTFTHLVLPCPCLAGDGTDGSPLVGENGARHGGGDTPGLIRRLDSAPEDATVEEAGAPPPADFEASSSRTAGLVEEPGPTEAGGVMVNLKGQFRSSLVLERRPDGSTVQRCIANLPGVTAGEH